MTLEITLVRHGESEANAAGLWQGQGDARLSDEGHSQAQALGARLAARSFDRVVSSDLIRASGTGILAGLQPEPMEGWRETDLGMWDGLTFDEVRGGFIDDLRAIRRGEDVPFGKTGETLEEFEVRVLAAFDDLAEDVGEGSAIVFTHGGVIDALVGRALGRPSGRRAVPIATNTALTVFRGRPGRMRLATFNDYGHLGREAGFLAHQRAEGSPIIGFLRHGVTHANKEQRVQGQSGSGLHPEGAAQARAFADWYGPVDTVYTSPLERATETATYIANGTPLSTSDELAEMSFGAWEGLGYEEMLSHPDAHKIWSDGEDLPRGGTGESFGQVQQRVRRFLDSILIPSGKRVVAVSHGGTILALAAAITDRGFDIARSVETAGNACMTHVVITETGPMLADYSVGPS